MFCSYCGSKLEFLERPCEYCGKKAKPLRKFTELDTDTSAIGIGTQLDMPVCKISEENEPEKEHNYTHSCKNNRKNFVLVRLLLAALLICGCVIVGLTIKNSFFAVDNNMSEIYGTYIGYTDTDNEYRFKLSSTAHVRISNHDYDVNELYLVPNTDYSVYRTNEEEGIYEIPGRICRISEDEYILIVGDREK